MENKKLNEVERKKKMVKRKNKGKNKIKSH